MKTVIRTALTFPWRAWRCWPSPLQPLWADGLTTPAAVAAETSVLETEAASHPCSIGLNGTCKDESTGCGEEEEA